MGDARQNGGGGLDHPLFRDRLALTGRLAHAFEHPKRGQRRAGVEIPQERVLAEILARPLVERLDRWRRRGAHGVAAMQGNSGGAVPPPSPPGEQRDLFAYLRDERFRQFGIPSMDQAEKPVVADDLFRARRLRCGSVRERTAEQDEP